MDADEVKAVAQAIMDAHAHKPGLDCSGRIDDAKTMIAAFDAIQALRSRGSKAAKPTPTPVEAEPAAPPAANDAPADNVTPIKPKAKGKKA